MKCPLIALILVCTLSFSFAQEMGYLPGYVVTTKRDTIHGLVKYANFAPYRVLPNIKFKETEESKKKTYSPDEILGYEANGKIFHSVRAPGRTENYFMELVVDGRLRLYRYTETKLGAPDYMKGETADESMLFLKKRSGEVFEVRGSKFNERLSTYLADKADLSEKIKRGDYKRRDIEEVVKEYNTTL